MAPPPPMPFIQGSTTPSAKPVATTASMQSPPAASTSAPISAARRDCAATMPPLELTADFRKVWELEKRSAVMLLSLPSGSFGGPIVKPSSPKTSRACHLRDVLRDLAYFFAALHHGYWLGMSCDTFPGKAGRRFSRKA